MTGIYFSGTGNTKFCVEKFIHFYDGNGTSYSIEDKIAVEAVKNSDEIVIGYPVQYSSVPKILYDFIEYNKELWNGKKIFVIATMGLFSGDGAGILARLLKKYGADITGGLHLKMPDSICDEKVLKRSDEDNHRLVCEAVAKIKTVVFDIKSGNFPQDGLKLYNRLAGLFGQRLYFGHKTKKFSDKLTINSQNCVGCGKCIDLCPMNNLLKVNRKVVARGKCTLCYRCVNRCPKQAITLLGKKVVLQTDISKYSR